MILVMRVLITSGGTKVPIDSVRHIGNMSSGTFGAKIGYEALRAGHNVKGKLRTKAEEVIQLTPFPKLISQFKAGAMRRPPVLVGFKLMVDSDPLDLRETARKSLVDNDCDLIVANDLRDIKANNHLLMLVTREGVVTRGGVEYRSSRDNDPNYLAREVVNKYTWLFNHRA